MARKSGARMINSSRWQKYATVLVTKQLEQIADNLEKDATKIIEDKLLKTYKTEVLASYSPRSEEGKAVQEYNEYQKSREAKEGYKRRLYRKKMTYKHTKIFENSIYTEVSNKTVKIKIRDEQYPDGASTTQVYEWLTKGTKGSEKPYPYIKVSGDSTNPDSYDTGWGHNYPTPRHLFEEHTREQMKGFLDDFKNSIERDKKYKSKKYAKKRR